MGAFTSIDLIRGLSDSWIVHMDNLILGGVYTMWIIHKSDNPHCVFFSLSNRAAIIFVWEGGHLFAD